MNWHSAVDWQTAVTYGIAAGVIVYVLNTIRHMLEVLKCINTNLAILTDRLAPPPSNI